MLKECPDCQSLVKGHRCECGYVFRSAEAKAAASELYRCVAIDDYGVRCSRVGVSSHSTNGGGPWLCRWHDPQGSRDIPVQLSPEQRQAEARRYCEGLGLDTPRKVRAYAKELLRRKPTPDPIEWAQRIMSRQADGESIHPTVLRLAEQAMARAGLGASDGR